MNQTSWIRRLGLFFLLMVYGLTLEPGRVRAAELVVQPAPPGEPAFEDCTVQFLPAKVVADTSGTTDSSVTKVPGDDRSGVRYCWVGLSAG